MAPPLSAGFMIIEGSFFNSEMAHNSDLPKFFLYGWCGCIVVISSVVTFKNVSRSLFLPGCGVHPEGCLNGLSVLFCVLSRKWYFKRTLLLNNKVSRSKIISFGTQVVGQKFKPFCRTDICGLVNCLFDKLTTACGFMVVRLFFNFLYWFLFYEFSASVCGHG